MIRFGAFQLDPVQGLRRGQREVRLTPRSLAVLALLAGKPGRVVTKEELFTSVWQETAVTDAAIATCIQEIRRALGDQSRNPRFIETLHRRGYRFVAQCPTRHLPGPPMASLSRQPRRSLAGHATSASCSKASSELDRGPASSG